MKKYSIWKITAAATFLCALGACTNSSAPDDDFDYDDSVTTSSTSTTKRSSSSTGTTKCSSVKDTLAAPTNFSVTKDTDTSWTLSWAYSRNSSRGESGFEVQALDLEASSPDWESEGSTNSDVNIYKLKGSKKANKYYRVLAYDGCGTSKESNRVQIKSDGSIVDDSTTTIETASDLPTDVSITRIAPSVWDLSWKYSDNKDDPNRKFIIQYSKLKDFKWTALKSPIEGNVRHYYIEGLDKIETYYRMAVVNSGDTSAFTDAIQLTPDIAYRSYMSIETPVFSPTFTTLTTKIAETDTTQRDVTVGTIASYTISDNMISKYVIESEYTDTVYYEARWFTSLEHYSYFKENCDGKKKSEKCDSCYWSETFRYQEPSISKRFDALTDYIDAAKKTSIYVDCYESTSDADGFEQCLLHYAKEICGYYVQFRIVWKDNINGKGKGATDWTEWTTPYSLNNHPVCSAE